MFPGKKEKYDNSLALKCREIHRVLVNLDFAGITGELLQIIKYFPGKRASMCACIRNLFQVII